MDSIKYRKGYKYQLAETYEHQIPILKYDIQTEFIDLSITGLLRIKRGYAWDGCSGPTIDRPSNMRGGLVHDAGYQLLRLGLLPEEMKDVFDKLLHDICVKDGMWRFSAWYYFEGVDHFAKYAATYGSDPYPVLTAP